jgi:hypothetical protein
MKPVSLDHLVEGGLKRWGVVAQGVYGSVSLDRLVEGGLKQG